MVWKFYIEECVRRVSGTYHVSAIARNLHAICSDILRRLKHTKIGFEFVLGKKERCSCTVLLKRLISCLSMKSVMMIIRKTVINFVKGNQIDVIFKPLFFSKIVKIQTSLKTLKLCFRNWIRIKFRLQALTIINDFTEVNINNK